MRKFWSIWVAISVALTAMTARAEVVTDFAPFTWDSARPEVLVLEGEITRRTPPLLGLALGRFETVDVLALSSPGGDAYAAMAMVPTIRAAGLATRIEAGDTCHSACSFLFFAGTTRAAEGELGVHQLASANEASGHFIMNDVLDMFSDLGVPDAVRRRMMQTPPDEMYVFSHAELASLGLVGPAPRQGAPGAPAGLAPVAEPDPGALASEEASKAKAPVYPDHEEIFVNDYADLIDAAGEDRIRQRLKDLGRVGGVQATVLTIASRDAYTAGGSLEAFATGLFNSWGIGDATRNDGILILVARDDREMRVELGSGYPARYHALAQEVIDGEFLPAFGAGQFSQGIERGVTAVIEKIALPARRGIAAGAPDSAAGPRAGFEVRFDFTGQGGVTLNIGWTFPPDLLSFVDCEDGETTVLASGLTACLISYSEPEERLLASDPTGGLQLSAANDGSRTLTIEMAQFLAQVTPTPEEAVKLADARFSIVVAANRIVETTGMVGADKSTATLELTVRQIVQRPDTVPETFTTRFF